MHEELEGFLHPRSAAVVGASRDPMKGGHDLTYNLVKCLPGRVYPVNPRYDEVAGAPCFASLADLPETPDLAVLFVPAKAVPEVLRQCAAKGTRCVMLQGAGFAETGPEGARLQDECLAIARRHGLRLWGPNCMGVVDGNQPLVASFMRPAIWEGKLQAGGVSLIVQSGMLAAGFLMQVISQGYFGLAKACSIGNRVDVGECDLLEYFAHDPETEVVALYLESVSDPPRFRAAVENLGRPVVLLKGGLSPAGAQAALSHTGSLAGNAAVAEGFFRQLGLHRAHDFVELMDLTKALYLWRQRTGGKRVGVITFSGAAGIVAADHLCAQGLELAQLSPASLERLAAVFPAWMEPHNPVDLWPAIEKSGRAEAYGAALEALLNDPNVDAVQVHYFVEPAIMAAGMDCLAAAAASPKPVTFWPVGDAGCFDEFRQKAEAMGAPVFGEISRGVAALVLAAAEARRPGRRV
ncbi:MAG: CoA-binding protein [Pseudomonadota bacterium]